MKQLSLLDVATSAPMEFDHEQKQRLDLISQIEPKIFIYPGSQLHKRTLKQAIVQWLKKGKVNDLVREMIDTIWLINDKGKRSMYMHFNEKAQKLYLDNTVKKWCRLVAEQAEFEILKMKK